ncbi:hypothetical protein BASA81_001869 [Batrachochytrium salamandrivorans]|nr:hypothetical protein BASA81_001869 [Batrachochytrium salamandrivorans]
MVDFLANAENMKPMREGRTPQVLLRQPVDPRKQRNETESAADRLRSQLAEEDGDHLKAHIDYIRALKSLYPSGSRLINEAIYDAAMHFAETTYPAELGYKDDPRLLDVFLQLADKQQNPKDTFVFMQTHQISQQLPSYHLAFGSVLERLKDFENAGLSYAQAVYVAKTEKDLDLAKYHFGHYKRRMARRAQETRAIHGPRSPDASKATAMRGGGVGRPPLPRQVLGSGRPQPVAALAQQQQPAMMGRKPSSSMGLGKSSNAQPSFAIYDENSQGKASAKRPLEASWKTLAVEQTAVENHGPAQAWTAASTMPSTAHRAPQPKKQQPAFEIFHEDDEGGEDGADESKQQQHTDLRIAVPTIQRTTTTRRYHNPSPSFNLDLHHQEQDERTINSQMAFNDMMDIFGSGEGGVMATPHLGGRNGGRSEEEGENLSPNVLEEGEDDESFAPIPMTAAATAPRTTRGMATAPRTAATGGGGGLQTAHRRPILAVIEHDEEGVSPSFRRELHFPASKRTAERFQVFQDDTASAAPLATRKVSTHQPTPGRRPAAAASSALFFAREEDEEEGEEGDDQYGGTEDVTYDGGTFGISRVLAFDAVSAARPRLPPTTTARAPPASSSSFRSGGFAVFRDE